jgi:DNA-binding MarR family transcriptional regulator
MNKANWSVYIPASILMDKDLSSTEKILIAVIRSLSNNTGACYATNNYLADLLNINKVRVSSILTALIKKKYIEREITRNEKKQIISRSIKVINDTPINKKDNRSINENVKHPISENRKGNNVLFNKIKIEL